jgi:hypothetical protein
MQKKENLLKSIKSNPAKESYDQALLRLHQLTLHPQGENQAQNKPGTNNPIHKTESMDNFKPMKMITQKYKTNRRNPNNRRRVSPLKQKSFKNSKMTQATRGVGDSAREAVDAVIAVMVPGHEEAVRKRKDRARRRLSLNDSFITLFISSGIMAAILAT